jgi:hypothetical protein
MRVTVPVPIGDTKLISTNVPVLAAGEANYNAGTTYAVDAQVVDPATHRKYQSLQGGNVGKPLPVYPITKNDWWFDIGVTNQRAMFDLERNTQTVGIDQPDGSSKIVVTFAPGERVNTIAVLGMEADSITVTATSSGMPVYSATEDLRVREVLDHYMYAYKPFSTRPSFVRFDMPPFSNIVITVTVKKNTSGVKCGSVVVGTYAYVGATQRDAESDALNFSTIDRDAFGKASLVRKRSVPKTVQRLYLAKARVNDVAAIRLQLNAIPALWTGLDDGTDGYFDILLILGIYKKFTINTTHPQTAIINLELEEI